MNKIKAVARKPYLWVFSCICIFILLSAFKLGAFRASTSKTQADFPVVSLVPNLVVVDINIIDKYALLLSLRNDSSKTITAISLSSSGVNYRSDFIDTDSMIAPGAIYTEQCGLPSPNHPEKGITVLAVVYDDGTSGGDAKYVRQIYDVRAGTQAQLTRILPLFRDAIATPKNMRLKQKQEAIELVLQQLPEEEEGKSLEFRQGLHDTKESAIDRFKELERIEQEKGEDVARQVLSHIVNSYEKRNLSILSALKSFQ